MKNISTTKHIHNEKYQIGNKWKTYQLQNKSNDKIY